METVVQGMVESDMRSEYARVAAQGNPQFTDPTLRAFVTEFEADYERFGLDWEGLLVGASEPCAMDPKQAYYFIQGVDHDKQQEQFASYGLTNIVDLDSIELRMISGACPTDGMNETVEFVGTTRTIMRFGRGDLVQVMVQDTASRFRGSFRTGERHGPVRDIRIVRSVTFKPGENGILEVQKQDWDYLREISEAPTAIYTYMSSGDDFRADPSITFSRNPTIGLYSTTVQESRGGDLRYSSMFIGTELRSEGGLKGGLQHGWQIYHSHTWQGHTIPGSRRCLQNGEEIKATVCPFE